MSKRDNWKVTETKLFIQALQNFRLLSKPQPGSVAMYTSGHMYKATLPHKASFTLCCFYNNK